MKLEKLTKEELIEMYKESLDTIADQKMVIKEMGEEIDQYAQAYDELQNEVVDLECELEIAN